MEIEILDTLLRYLLDNSNNSFSFIKNDDKLKSKFSQEVENDTLSSALLKLVKDEYVNSHLKSVGFNSDESLKTVEHYNISFEGIFFIKNGGYENQIRMNKKKENENIALQKKQFLLEDKHSSYQFQLTLLTWVVVFGTVVAGIYYTIEVLKFFGFLNSCSYGN